MTRLLGIISGSKPGNTKKYNVFSGISDDNIEKLVQETRNDPFFRTHTSDLRGSGRFSSRASFDAWRGGDKRDLYSLVELGGDFSGILWISREQLHLGSSWQRLVDLSEKDYLYTWGLRIYKDARNTGLAMPFIKLAMDHFSSENSSSSPKFWIETDTDNQATRRIGEKLCYTLVAQNNETNRIIMIKPIVSVKITT